MDSAIFTDVFRSVPLICVSACNYKRILFQKIDHLACRIYFLLSGEEDIPNHV